MRRADLDEVKATSNSDPVTALHRCVKSSDLCATVEANGVPIAVLGLSVLNILTGIGSPWLLSTEQALNHKREFLRLSPPVVREMLQLCPTLYNYVHCDNKVSIRWLKWLGFTFSNKPIEYGVNNELFYRFEMRADHV